jgi:hypothetical protein
VVLHPTTSSLIIGLVIDAALALLGYRLSENDRRVLGRTPWGLPSVLWAVFWFFFPVGLVLFLIAHFTALRHPQQHSPAADSPVGVSSGPTMARPRGSDRVSDLFPAYPRPANSQPPSTDTAREPAVGPDTDRTAQPTGHQTPDVAAGWPNSPPAWQPDPSGRFHYRWWDGYQWTSQVSTDGHHLVDTNPDQRIGPY